MLFLVILTGEFRNLSVVHYNENKSGTLTYVDPFPLLTLNKLWIIEEPNTLELWNKLHFEEKKNEECIPCLKYSVSVFVE